MASSDVNRELEGHVVNLRTELKRLQETYRQEVGDIQTRLEELRALREEPVPLNYVSIQQYEKLMEAYDCEKAEFAKMKERYMREKTEWAKWQQWFYDHGVKTVSTPRSKHSQVKTPVKDRTAARANTQTPRKLEDSPTPRKSQNTQYADTVIGSQSPQLWRTVKREPMSSPLQMHAVGDAYDSLDLDDISETLQQKMDPPLEQIAEEGSCEVSVKSDQHVPKIESPSSSEVFPSQPSPSKPVKGVEVTLPSRNVVIDAAANDGLNYAYEEVVRGHKRKQMHAEDCPCCSKFYTMAAGAGLVQGSTRITPMQMKQQHSRHRYHFKRQQTPPGFWNADFPTTQEEQEYRRQGLEMQRRAHEEKAAIARQGGGRYKFSK